MPEHASCPGLERWTQLLKGSLPEREQLLLTGHLETCPRCQSTLEGLAADRAAWTAAARHLGRGGRADEAALHQVLADLEAGPAPPLRQAEEDGGEDLSLDFLSPPAEPGHLGSLDHYEVLDVVGRGGMGVVLKAFDRALHRVVAIKVLALPRGTGARARKRFVREARAAAAVRHEHVIDIHAVAEANGVPYLVMEYVAGTSLQQRLDRSGPLELKEVVRIGMQAARGLAAAHKQGLVHRDVKPANILLENGVARVKITDFGLARVIDDPSLSQSGVVAGTPQYMAPEQTRGEPLDHRADLFSLGSALYAMCTGRAPFDAGSTLGVLKRVCDDPPRPIPQLNPAVPPWLVALVEKLHAKDPADRYQSAAEVAELLEHHLALLQQSGRRPPAAQGPPPRGDSRPPRAGLRRWAAAAAVLLLAGWGMAEATGVTQVVPAVIRIAHGDGTLVVEADDPQVKVSVEGDGGLVITGAGPQEVRLHPGSYRLRASKGGQTVCEELVTIARGGRQVVKVSRETGRPAAAEGPAAPAPAPARRFEGHTGPVICLAISPDGRRALSGSADLTVRLWDLATGQELGRLDGHTGEVAAVAFSADGRRAASGGEDRTVRLWDLKTGGALGCFRGHTEKVRSVAFSPDDRFVVSGGEDNTVRLWDLNRRAEARCLAGHEGWVTSVAVSGDGRRILSGSCDRTVRVWDFAGGTPLRRLEGHTREVYAVAFSPDGRRAASGGDDRTVRLWGLDGGRESLRLTGHGNAVVRVAFSPDGRQVLSASSQYQAADQTFRIWDAATGREVAGFGGTAADRLACAAFAPDGRTALSGGSDPALRLWRLSK
jgi:hypothetical protein